ncbi:MAG TPA: methyltransferase domain-containing protein [Roseiarcus sp.]|nr:methyltransferase domain-containing protein [Roseiarcus sp.]
MNDQNAPTRRLAYGVDPQRPERYSLRQARYDALAGDIDALAGVAAREGRRLSVLDIGAGAAATPRHLRARPNFRAIDIDGTDIERRKNLDESLYRRLFIGDLTKGYPELASGAYDVVVCEQVLEHLHELKIPMETIGRLVRPDGRAFVGVPIFIPPLHLARRHLVPHLDRLMGRRRRRDHVQAFTLAQFRAALVANSKLEFVEARGFRIVSGGLLRPLEEFRGWWAFNRWLGARLPGACIEVQVVLQKPAVTVAAA